MIKRFSLMLFFALFVMTTSCKKEDASSKIDKNATEIAPADPNAVNPEPNISGPEVPVETTAPEPKDGKYPIIEFETKEHDFGKINQGDKVSYDFKFKNSGESDLLITDARGSCGCTVPDYPKTAIKPGESSKIKVSFDSKGKNGENKKTVTLVCNTKDKKEMLTIKASINALEGAKK
jgi:hypothetical protein